MIQTIVVKNRLTEILTSRITGIISFSLLTAIAAQITIPVNPVPFTLQTVAVVLSGAFLGAKNGAYSQLLYLFLGSIGLPVFAQVPGSSIGIAVLLGPTGGYLLAFPLAAYLAGLFIERKRSYLSVTIGMFLANLLIILMGVIHLEVFYIKNLNESLIYGAAIFSLWTIIKVFASVNIFYFIKKAGKKS